MVHSGRCFHRPDIPRIATSLTTLMPVIIADIIKIMEDIAPSCLAEEWDNVGLQVGQKDWPVRNIRIALDPLPNVVAAACREKVDLLITHHPLIFKPLSSVDFSTPVGAIINMASKHKMAIFAAHTNLDNVTDGLNDILAYRIGLNNLKVLGDIRGSEDCQGLGRIGDLIRKTKLASFALEIKKKLGLNYIKVAGKPDLFVKKAALCTGSGSSLINNFFASGAQVYISGDLRYHDARAAEAANLGIIDIGHFASEHLIVEVLARRLREIISKSGIDVKVEACESEIDPFVII